jgi:co-chaperonin GroES (HSP10)
MLRYDIRQAPVNTVIVEVGKTLEDTVTFGSMTLHIDPEFNPTHHARIFGRIVAVPDGRTWDYEGNTINDKVEVGDLIYFHYLVTSDETNCIYGNYYKVPYYWIFCAIRSGNILPIGGWSLCEPMVEQEYDTVEVGGKKMEATLSASGLVTSVFKTPSVDIARLAYIGKPVGDEEDSEARVGSKVILAKNSNFLNKIEGKDYYTVKQQYILALK